MSESKHSTTNPWPDQLREATTPKEWRKVVAALLKAAQGGDMDAAELCLDYLMPLEDIREYE